MQGGRGGGRAGSFGEGMLFFVLVTRNKQKILNTVDFFFSTVFSFAMGKEEGRRRERGGMAGGKENWRDVVFIEKWEYLGKNNQRGRKTFSLERE